MDPRTSAQSSPASIEVVKNDFDLVAPIYDALATLVYAGAIRRAQVALLPQLQNARTALVIAGGTGWFLTELLARTKVTRVLYIEQSPKMLNKSRQLLNATHPEWNNRVEFRLGTEESITGEDGPFDLLVTNFFLDLFNDANCAQMVQRLHPHLAPAGRWLFVDFHVPEHGIRRVAARVLFKVMYTFFNIVSRMESRRPPNYRAALEPAGLRTELEETFYATMIRAKLLIRA